MKSDGRGWKTAPRAAALVSLRRQPASETVGRVAKTALVAVASAASWSCELVEVEVARPDDVVVAEAALVLASDAGAGRGFAMSALALLHRTRQETGVAPVDGATVRVSDQDGRSVVLLPEPRGLCVDSLDWRFARDLSGASCYRAAPTEEPFVPGDRLTLEVVLADGGALEGASQVPSLFSMPDLRLANGVCGMLPETQQRIDWTQAEGAWAYKNEARISGYAPSAGSAGRSKPVHLELLAIGREETGLVFPRSFGLSEYLDETYDRELILRLRDGLPEGASAELSVTAIDRNWMNWARTSGITFSGVVRIPSVFGDGTGAFATGVRRRFEVAVEDAADLPACGPAAVGSAGVQLPLAP